MLKAQMEYGAVHTKILGMYGKMLKDEDWRRLSELKSVTEVCAFLRSHRGWSATMTELPPAPTTKMLKTAVSRRVYEDYEKLYKYLLSEDKKLLRFIVYRAEYDFIVDALREKRGFEPLPKSLELTDFVRQNSKVDIAALEHSTSYTAVLVAIRGSIFERPLLELKVSPETGRPDYLETCIVLENAYFKSIFSYISKKYKGLGKKKLEETIGLEADLLNIVSEIRLHRSFHDSLEKVDELLIPVLYHIKPEFLHALSEAKDEAELLDLLRKSSFGKLVAGANPANIEDFYYRSLDKFCRKIIKAAEPDVSAALAYMILKDLECRKLNRVIEAISSGYDPKSVI